MFHGANLTPVRERDTPDIKTDSSLGFWLAGQDAQVDELFICVVWKNTFDFIISDYD